MKEETPVFKKVGDDRYRLLRVCVITKPELKELGVGHYLRRPDIYLVDEYPDYLIEGTTRYHIYIKEKKSRERAT
jgi:hypothetical protein